MISLQLVKLGLKEHLKMFTTMKEIPRENSELLIPKSTSAYFFPSHHPFLTQTNRRRSDSRIFQCEEEAKGRELREHVQSPKIWLVRGLVKFVPAR